jgi:hypothetical protein
MSSEQESITRLLQNVGQHPQSPSSFPVEMCEESELSELSLLLHGFLVGGFFVC